MRVLRWAGVSVLVLALLLGLASGGGYMYLSESTIPERGGELSLEGLEEPVEVRREPSGMVHIDAENEHDLFFSMGVAHAQDRLWQMEFQRRTGAGRLSEVLGKATVEQDKFLRTWGFYGAAEEAYGNLSPEGKRTVDAYVAGINAYLDTGPPLPLEFQLLGYEPEEWRPADVLVWLKMMSFSLSTNWETELERLRLLDRGLSRERIAELSPTYPEDAPTIAQPEGLTDSEGAGETARELLELGRSLPGFRQASNNWVVSGELTESGEPLLANDPHLGLQVPSVWHLMHLESPSINAVGATLPGLPGVVIGNNEEISWGVTNVGADVQDLYVMEDARDGEAYRHEGEVRDYQTREEVIEVSDAEDVTILVRESVYGPVISDVVDNPGDHSLSLRWTSLAPEDRTLESFVRINRAGGWEEFNEALRGYRAPSQNFVYADVEGNIGYVAPGEFPVRAEGHSGLYPMPGTGEYNWQDRVPYEEWPRVLNPEEGFVATANNKATPEEYPYTLSREWAEPYRVERIRQMIREEEKVSVEDMASMQLDQKTLLYRDFRPVLKEMEPQSNRAQEWRELLLEWDGGAGPGGREAVVFEAWYTELTGLPSEEVGQERWDEPRYLLEAMSEGDEACEPATAQGCLEFAAGALERALERLGVPVPEWGEMHESVFAHEVLTNTPLSRLSDRRVPFGGDGYTVNVGGYDPESFDMTHGPSYRQIVALSDPESSRFVMPMGQSGHPLSKWFDNLLPVWQQGEYLPMRTEGYPVEMSQTLTPSG